MLSLFYLFALFPDTLEGPVELLIEIFTGAVFITVLKLTLVDVTFLVVDNLACTRAIAFCVRSYIFFSISCVSNCTLAVQQTIYEVPLDVHVRLNAHTMAVDKAVYDMVREHFILCLLVSRPLNHNTTASYLIFNQLVHVTDEHYKAVLDVR